MFWSPITGPIQSPPGIVEDTESVRPLEFLFKTVHVLLFCEHFSCLVSLMSAKFAKTQRIDPSWASCHQQVLQPHNYKMQHALGIRGIMVVPWPSLTPWPFQHCPLTFSSRTKEKHSSASVLLVVTEGKRQSLEWRFGIVPFMFGSVEATRVHGVQSIISVLGNKSQALTQLFSHPEKLFHSIHSIPSSPLDKKIFKNRTSSFYLMSIYFPK